MAFGTHVLVPTMFTLSKALLILLTLALGALNIVDTATAQVRHSLAIDAQRLDAGSGWSVGFSEGGAGCVAIARYRDSTRVWFGASARHGTFVAFANTAWKSIEAGGGYELFIQVHGGRRWRINTTGAVIDGEPGVISGDLKIDVIEDLARASGFVVELAGRRIFAGELSGSRRALTLAFECFQRNREEAERIASSQAPTRRDRPSSQPALSGNGTGFFIDQDGLIVTNEHVTRGCRAVSAGIPGSKFSTAAIKATDPVNDLSLLKIDTGPASTPPGLRTGLKLGESVAVFGFPLSNVGIATSGNFTMGYVSALAGLKNDTREYQISAPVQPGNSGGPMIDHMGNVVGVINSKLNALNVALTKGGDIPQNVNFAIKASVLQNFLETNGVSAKGAISSRKLEPTELAEHLKRFSVKIDCFR